MINKILEFFKKTKGDILKFDETYFFLIFLSCLGIHFYFSLVGWSHNILDQYGFRQTQTAISTYYTIKDGFKLNYITPVLGAPWSIPMEFPLFQWIVAILVIVLKTPLDQTGRFASLVFFYLSLIPLYYILGLWVKKRSYKLIILSLILLNPTYLFWSRTFMIESLALFLSFLFGALIVRFINNQNKAAYFWLAILIGCLAALTKVTTFIALAPALVFIFGYLWYKNSENKFSLKVLKKYLYYGLLLFGIPLLVTIAWNYHADVQKSLNVLANGFITSKALTTWNFGTFHQKINPATWIQIFEYSLIPNKLLGITYFGKFIFPNLIIFLLLYIILANSYRREIILSFVFFLVGPLIFTNLYFIHTYYYYANNFFLSILLGFFIISLMENNKRGIKLTSAVIILPFFLISLFILYKNAYYPYQKNNNISLENPTELIKNITTESDVLLIYGQTWDPSFAYYSQRKAIMDWQDLPLQNKKIQKALASLKGTKINALVLQGDYPDDFINERLKYFNFNNKPVFDNNGLRIYAP